MGYKWKGDSMPVKVKSYRFKYEPVSVFDWGTDWVTITLPRDTNLPASFFKPKRKARKQPRRVTK